MLEALISSLMLKFTVSRDGGYGKEEVPKTTQPPRGLSQYLIYYTFSTAGFSGGENRFSITPTCRVTVWKVPTTTHLQSLSGPSHGRCPQLSSPLKPSGAKEGIADVKKNILNTEKVFTISWTGEVYIMFSVYATVGSTQREVAVCCSHPLLKTSLISSCCTSSSVAVLCRRAE